MRRHAAKEQEKLFLCVYLDGQGSEGWKSPAAREERKG